MRDSASTCTEPLASIRPMQHAEGDLWGIVLAGREGVRLRSLARPPYGEARPKQYAVLTGATSLLRQTLDRVAWLIPPERTVVVTLDSDARDVAAELAAVRGVQGVAQR